MPMKQEEKVCGNCIYFAREEEVEHSGPIHYGECRIRSPRPHTADDDYIHNFPCVKDTEFCGAGLWIKYSDITQRTEYYNFDTRELCSNEEYK